MTHSQGLGPNTPPAPHTRSYILGSRRPYERYVSLKTQSIAVVHSRPSACPSTNFVKTGGPIYGVMVSTCLKKALTTCKTGFVRRPLHYGGGVGATPHKSARSDRGSAPDKGRARCRTPARPYILIMFIMFRNIGILIVICV